MYYQPEQTNPYHGNLYGQTMEDRHMNDSQHKKRMHEMCKEYHLYFMQFQTTEGGMLEGIIEDIDEDGIILLIPSGDMERVDETQRQFGFGYGYGYPRRFRRFRRQRLPFILIRNLLFPFYYFY